MEWHVSEMAATLAPIATGFLAYVILRANRHAKKVESARLIRELHQPWSKEVYPDFHKFLYDLMDGKVNKDTYSKERITSAISVFDHIAIFWKHGVLNEKQIKSFFGPNLKQIGKNRYICECITSDFEDLRSLLQTLGYWLAS